MTRKFTRRDFIRLSSISVVGLAALPKLNGRALAAGASASRVTRESERLGRVTAPSLQLMSRPGPHGERIEHLWRDDIVPIYREVVGEGWYPHNHVWYEVPGGYVYSSFMQPCEHVLNTPVAEIDREGVYAEISVPMAQALKNPNENSELTYDLYYAGVFLLDERYEDDETGQIWYHILDENYKPMWVKAEYLRIFDPKDVAPISADVEDKRIEVDLRRQRLSAFEGETEVFRTIISSGREFFGTDGVGTGNALTQAGSYPVWSKRISRHMSGGTADDGYDLPGVGWVVYFGSNGEAIHSTYWHNDYGRPRSAGCLNCTPEASRWLFRWTTPEVAYNPGKITVEWPGGTRINIFS